jgi:hypothetical protein
MTALPAMVYASEVGSSRMGFQDNLVWKFFPQDAEEFNTRRSHSTRSVVSIAGEIQTQAQRAEPVIFRAELTDSPSTGRLEYRRSNSSNWTVFSWDLDLEAPSISITSGNHSRTYRLTPVFIPSSNYGNQPDTDSYLKKLFPKMHSDLAIVLKSPSVNRHLPITLVEGFGLENDKATGSLSSSPEHAVQNVNPVEWGCSLECGGVLGAGALTVVSGGTLSASLVVGAAACGSCMGFVWGNAPFDQGPIELPPDGASNGATVGSILPPLPPGKVWSCTENSSGGYTCFPEDRNTGFDPY